MVKKIFIFIPLFFISILAQAQVNITATLDDTQITSEQDTAITVEVTGSLSVDAPEAPQVPGLKIVQTGRTSQFQFINGQTSISAVFIYRVVPFEEGSFDIGPFVVRVGGKQYQSNTLKLTVSKQATMIKPNTVPLQNQGLSQQNQNQPQADAPFWITTAVTKQSVYLSEQIIFKFTFYTSTHISDADLKLPPFDDFMTEVIVPEKRGQTIINGQQYATFEKVLALFPLKEGKLTIGETSMDLSYQAVASTPAHGNFDPLFFQFGNTVTKNTIIKAKSIEIEVKPLPQPLPATFTHLVGDFGMTAKLSAGEVLAGDSITLEISMSGSGNIKDAVIPEISLPGVKTYRDKPTLETHQSQNGVSGKKTFKIVMVPQKQGTVVIPETILFYFDPVKQNYMPMTLNAMTITVLPSENEQTNVVLPQQTQTNGTQEITYHDLAPLFPDAQRVLQSSSLILPHTFFAIIFWSLPSLFVLIVVVRVLKSRHKQDQRGRKKQAYRRFKERLSRKNLLENDVSDAIQTYMADVFGVAGQALTAQETKQICLNNNVREDVVLKLEMILQELEATQYGFNKQAMLDQAVKELLDIIQTVDRGIH